MFPVRKEVIRELNPQTVGASAAAGRAGNDAGTETSLAR
jgi:hypothetical protein